MLGQKDVVLVAIGQSHILFGQKHMLSGCNEKIFLLTVGDFLLLSDLSAMVATEAAAVDL
jgi:hypothetical protein